MSPCPPPRAGRCPTCHDLGWVLDAPEGGDRPPVSLEFLPCPLPSCAASGQPIEVLSLGGATDELPFRAAVPHPVTGEPMSLEGRT